MPKLVLSNGETVDYPGIFEYVEEEIVRNPTIKLPNGDTLFTKHVVEIKPD